MAQLNTIGVDLAKSVIQGDKKNKSVFGANRKVSRSERTTSALVVYSLGRVSSVSG